MLLASSSRKYGRPIAGHQEVCGKGKQATLHLAATPPASGRSPLFVHACIAHIAAFIHACIAHIIAVIPACIAHIVAAIAEASHDLGLAW